MRTRYRRGGSHVRVDVDLRGLAAVPRLARARVGQEMRLISLDLLSQGVRNAPVDEGTLRGSGSAHHSGRRIATGAEFDATAEAGHAAEGGQGTTELSSVVAFNEVYAAYQHETTDLNHPKGGQAKYLERPLNANRALYERKLADAYREALTEASR